MMKTVPLISPHDAKDAKVSAQLVVEVHCALTEFIRAGITLPEIDAFVANKLRELKCKSAFLKYKMPGQPPFPSHSCLSVNDCVVHGTHTMTQSPLSPEISSLLISVSFIKGGLAMQHGLDNLDRLLVQKVLLFHQLTKHLLRSRRRR